jgi:hypothetical protein
MRRGDEPNFRHWLSFLSMPTPLLPHAGQRHSVLWLKLAELRRLDHVHTLRWWLWRFRLEVTELCAVVKLRAFLKRLLLRDPPN